MKYYINKNVKSHLYHKHWQFCVGSGHAALAMRTDYCAQLKKVHQDLGIKYVRFHGIFNDDMNVASTFRSVLGIPGTEKFVERSFHRCQLVYDNILACGMKPFVELSFMPEVLAADPERRDNFYGSITSVPKDYKKWAEFIRDFIIFLTHRYGEEEMLTWYFEVWNEPDLEGMFFKGKQEDYFRLYEVTARAIKEVNPGLRVGGPSTSGSKWIKSFLEYCKKQDVPIDFVTSHQYAGEPLLGVEDEGGPDEEARSEKTKAHSNSLSFPERLAIFEKKLDSISENTPFLEMLRMFTGDPTEDREINRNVLIENAPIVKKQAGGLPLFYTEWNCSATFGAYSNDTRKVAAYDLRTALHTEHSIDGSSIWCFSDIFEELHQFKEEFHGGFGMQTLNGIPKPIYYMLHMLARTETYRMELDKYESADEGEIELSGFIGEKEVQFLIYRQSMKQSDDFLKKAEVSLELAMPPARMIMERIDDNHCNPLKNWEKLGRPENLRPHEINEITKQSELCEEELSYTYDNGIVNFSVELGLNDIYFIRIKR